MTKGTKEKILNMSYQAMLSLWRFSPIGHPYFQGEIGEYFSKIMKEKDALLDKGEHAKISKAIGW